MKYTTLAAAAAFALAPMTASAVTLSTNTVDQGDLGLLPTPTFIDPDPGAYYDGLVGNYLGDDKIPGSENPEPANNARSPWDGTDGLATNAYAAVVAGGSATWDFGDADKTYFSLMWGSPDTYNDIFFYNDGAEVYTINGGDLIPPGTLGAGFVNIVVTEIVYDSFTFVSDPSDAFEFANVNTIPGPFGALLIGTALLGAGAVRRFGRKAA